MEQALTALFTALITALVVVVTGWVKSFYEKLKKKREEVALKEKSGFEFINLVDAKIKNHENDLMKTYRPCRMFVLHFFNGEVTFNGLHLLKFAIKHEIVQGPHIRYMNPHFQREPVPELLSSSLKTVFEKGYHVDNYNDLEVNPPFQEMMDAWEFKSVLFIGLRSNNMTAPDVAPDSILVMQWQGPFPLQRNDILMIRSSDSKHNIEKIYQAKTLKELENGE